MSVQFASLLEFHGEEDVARRGEAVLHLHHKRVLDLFQDFLLVFNVVQKLLLEDIQLADHLERIELLGVFLFDQKDIPEKALAEDFEDFKTGLIHLLATLGHDHLGLLDTQLDVLFPFLDEELEGIEVQHLLLLFGPLGFLLSLKLTEGEQVDLFNKKEDHQRLSSLLLEQDETLDELVFESAAEEVVVLLWDVEDEVVGVERVGDGLDVLDLDLPLDQRGKYIGEEVTSLSHIDYSFGGENEDSLLGRSSPVDFERLSRPVENFIFLDEHFEIGVAGEFNVVLNWDVRHYN